MWPGQQPPGGEQNPQDQNQNQGQSPGQDQSPYQQPGHQQPNPYQQGGPQQPQQGYQQPGPYQQPPTGPGYQQPGPYQQPPTGPGYQQPGAFPQPPAQQWNVPTTPLGGPRPPERDERKRTTLVAIVAATAVVITAAVTGAVVLGGDGDEDGKPAAKASSSQKPSGKSTATENPRAGSSGKPQVAGWKTVVSTKWGVAFDVPVEWEITSPGTFYGYLDEEKDDGSAMIGWNGPAQLKSEWCSIDSDKDGQKEDHELAAAGTKGADGAKDLDEVAYQSAGTWVLAVYTQPNKKIVKISKPESFTSTSGIEGKVATAKSTGVPKKDRCSTEGKSISFGFENGNGDYVSWSLYSAAGVDEEIEDATMRKILKTVRLTEAKPTED